MSPSPGSLFPRLLTGFRVRVVRHPDPALEGLEGVVVEETSNALRLLLEDGRLVTVLKHASTLEVSAPGGVYIRLRGEVLLGNPVERVKEYRWRVHGRCRRRSRLRT